MNYTTASLPPTDQGFETLYRIIRDDMEIRTDCLLYNQNGTELSAEDFCHIGDNDIIYVKWKGNVSKLNHI